MVRTRFKQLIPGNCTGAGIINWKVDEMKKNGQNDEKGFDDVWGPSFKK